jgi:hypothetical protein
VSYYSLLLLVPESRIVDKEEDDKHSHHTHQQNKDDCYHDIDHFSIVSSTTATLSTCTMKRKRRVREKGKEKLVICGYENDLCKLLGPFY